jgi:pimeloyl-ACP methyl ester carboxylesterase
VGAMFATSSDGVRIAYEVHGTGPVLLLLHGFSNDRNLWTKHRWIEHLQPTFTVITMDMRGCGESDAPLAPNAYQVEQHLADVSAVADACYVDRLSLWGWSFGGTLGLHLAARSPRLQRAVIAGTYFGRLFTEAYVQRRLAETVRPVWRARWQGLQSWPGVEPEDVQCPTLVYTGAADDNVVVQLQQQRAAIEAAGVCLHVLNNLSHGGLVSAVDVVVPLILPFLQS